jgi:hypothetical protein
MSEAERRTEARAAARGFQLHIQTDRGYMIVTVKGLNKEQARTVRERFELEGWSASCKNGYTQVRAERKI